MLSGERLRGLVHPRGVERLHDVRVRGEGEDVGDRRVPDAVAVGLRLRGEAAVEVVADVLGCGDADVVRQEVVDAEDEPARRDFERDVGVRALRPRVDAGVGAPGALDAHGRAEEPRQRLLDDLLHADGVRLRLPSGVARAEVLKGEEDAQRGYCTTFRRRQYRGAARTPFVLRALHLTRGPWVA